MLGKRLIIGLIVASFLVFVAGSFVFAYLFLFSASAQVQQGSLPQIQIPSLPQDNPGAPTQTPTQQAASPTQEPEDGGRLNILLLGLDQRDDERGAPTRTDTMIVVSIDPKKKIAAMISLPRDMWVEIPGFANNRINVANFLGDLNKLPGGGPELAKKTVERNFGLKIDYYARVNFRGFEKIVDTLGGITVNVEKAIIDHEYPTEDYEVMSIYIPAGVQHMNGTVALQYARSRHSENDFGRAKRQQKVLLAIREKALALDVIPKIPSLMGTMKDMIDTDIPPQEMIRLGMMAKDIDADNVHSLVIDQKLVTPFKGEGGADLLMPKKEEIKAAISALFLDPKVKSEAATIEVANGSGQSGLATRTGEYLISQGFDVVDVSSADRNDYKTTQILVNTGKTATAKALAEILKLSQQSIVMSPAATPSTSAVRKSWSNEPDIKIILGQDFKLPR
ncbi:MAG: LCP family protein [Chloroflexota bacterium]|jgi:LCP family protein required for cell wall assembly